MEDLNFTKNEAVGAQYHRANKIILDNGSEDSRMTVFHLEQVTNSLSGTQVKTGAGLIFSQSPTEDEAATEVNLVNLEGEVLGAMPLGQMHQAVLLYINSYMIHVAREQNRLSE